jgi:hypothetical protein
VKVGDLQWVRIAPGQSVWSASNQGDGAGNKSVEVLWCNGSFPSWIANRLAHLDLNRIDLNRGPLAAFFDHLAHENTAKSREILVEADPLADALGLDEELLDGLLVGVGLE